jgi:thioesterase domain-containing protein/acyl carrier protein
VGDSIVIDHQSLRREGVAPTTSVAVPDDKLPRPRGLGEPESATSEIEGYLVTVWQEALKLAPIGVNDNYFDLGGDSLSAVAIFSELERATGTSFPVSTIFKHPTIRDLAAEIIASPAAPDDPRLVVLKSEGAKTPLFFTHGGGPEVFMARRIADRFTDDRPLIAIRAAVETRVDVPRSIEALAAEYTDVIRRHRPHGPYLISGFCIGSTVALEVARNLTDLGEEVLPLLIIDGPRSGSIRILPWVKYHIREVAECSWMGAAKYVFGRLAPSHKRTWQRRATEPEARPSNEENMRLGISRTAFTDALVGAYGRHRPTAYGGSAIVFSSAHLVELTGDDALGWRDVISGKVTARSVADTHKNVFGMAEGCTLAQALNDEIADLP